MKIFKRIMCMLLLITVLTGDFSAAVPAHADTEVFEDNGNGTVTINFEVEKDTTVLVLVYVPSENVKAGSNEADRYYYKLKEGSNSVQIPLTKGTGTYKIIVCKVLSTGKATPLKSYTVDLTEYGNKKVFGVNNFVVDYGVSDEFIKKAKTLTKGSKTENAKVKKIYEYIIKNYAYDYELLSEKQRTSYYNPNNKSTFERKLGICYDISSLFAAMLRSVGVEARVVTGHTPNVKEYHAWTQVWDSKKKKWYTIDCTYDMCLYNAKSSKKYTMVKKDSDYSDIKYIY